MIVAASCLHQYQPPISTHHPPRSRPANHPATPPYLTPSPTFSNPWKKAAYAIAFSTSTFRWSLPFGLKLTVYTSRSVNRCMNWACRMGMTPYTIPAGNAR